MAEIEARQVQAAHVRLRCTFPPDWTCYCCKKYDYESDFGSPVQAL